MAVVGGSNLILSHQPMVALSMLRYSNSQRFGSNTAVVLIFQFSLP